MSNQERSYSFHSKDSMDLKQNSNEINEDSEEDNSVYSYENPDDMINQYEGTGTYVTFPRTGFDPSAGVGSNERLNHRPSLNRHISMRRRNTRSSFSISNASAMSGSMVPTTIRRSSGNRPGRRTSFKEDEHRGSTVSRRLNLKVARRSSERSSGGSDRSSTSERRGKRSSSSAESRKSVSTTYSAGEKLSEGGVSLLRRLISRGTSRRSEDSLSGDMDNHEALEYIARRADDSISMDTAAAQLVAVGMLGSKVQSRFSTNEHVLVSLEVMNQSAFPELISREPKLRNALNGNEIPDEKFDSDLLDKLRELEDKFTSEPVNRFGYPEGQGTKVEEQRGPYLYVLATVKMVHFEEDARYYTVTRSDTGKDQRADSEWMWGEAITSEKGLEAAQQAAKKNRIVKAEEAANKSKTALNTKQKTRVETFIENFITSPISKVRVITKHQITLFVLGLSPYSCEIRFTGINLLVFCSFLFLFLDQVRLAYAPPQWDKPIIILNALIWFILAFELLFELLIRPAGYSMLTRSDKKYNPSTARFLNRFHLITEGAALILFIPEMRCLFSSKNECGEALGFTLLDATMKKSFGPHRRDVALAIFMFGMLRLRIFGLVRHFKQMWFIRNIIGLDVAKETIHKFSRVDGDTEITETMAQERERLIKSSAIKKRKADRTSAIMNEDKDKQQKEKMGPTAEEDRRLNNAANIGTALIVINSHRAMILLMIIVGSFPFVALTKVRGGSNMTIYNLVSQLQRVNEMLPLNNTEQCSFLEKSIENWLESTHETNSTAGIVLWARLLPIRCDFQIPSNGLITNCGSNDRLWDYLGDTCEKWNDISVTTTKHELAESLNIRVGNIHTEFETDAENVFSVLTHTNVTETILFTNTFSILLQVLSVVLILLGLYVLRGDAGRLVIEPLRRMIKIVLHYAKNPLSPPPKWTSKKKSKKDGKENMDNEEDEVGNFETEQLITAVTKITDLLRKCWGVAGAGIISSNLARTESGKTVVFNPLVPGKLVYALFGFCGIMDFQYLLHALDHSIIELINDVAKVVHDEVFRWGLGSRGQCNKNLGSAFLMVHRIGDFKEVHEKKNKATNVIFEQKQGQTSTSSRKRRGKVIKKKKGSAENRKLPFETIDLASLPGISAFTDRAVFGMLKSFAGIHRDRSLLKWREDFRLGAGVGAFTVDMIFGMDAGWGVEGAVGSEHKIDATYLSPHVNMAARMMSATKQFGVHLLLSQAAADLLSSEAKSKMRHLDTVTVKGSSVAQRIYTFDAKHTGVDFFLYSKTERLANLDSDRFTPNTWNTDRDLLAMRQHVNEEFLQEFNQGRDSYLSGDWESAIKHLKKANNIMIATVVDEGVCEYEIEGFDEDRLLDENDKDEDVVRLRKSLGDGPSNCLISFMQNRGGVAPEDWEGYRPLTSK